ncbi:MAG TPA: hypothetical protein DDZ68_12790 [Parvularcula sp.]|nr:hypothetical protein [Parvularcula sp.]HBS31469.1 hypothetical protein [Parvularcula sp.]
MTIKITLSAATLAAAALALAGCGKKESEIETIAPVGTDAPTTETPSAGPEGDLLPPGFPKPAADFKGLFDMGVAGRNLEVTIIGSGPRQRIEFPPGEGAAGPSSPWTQVMVSENNGEKILMWPEGENAPKIAATLARNDVAAMAVSFGVDTDAASRGKKTGEETIAGEKCAVWEMAVDEAASVAPGDVCVTRDGIVMRAISGGQTVLLAKSITRGKQDEALFAPPADYEVADMGECMRIGAEAMELARAGKMPDLAKMEKCRVLGEKLGAMFSE